MALPATIAGSVPLATLELNLPRGVRDVLQGALSDVGAPVRLDPDQPITLAGHAHRFGFTVTAEASWQDADGVDRVVTGLVQEEIACADVVVGVYAEPRTRTGHACEADPRYRWLTFDARFPLPLGSTQGRTSREVHEVHRALECARHEAIADAIHAVDALPREAAHLRGVPPALAGAVLEALRRDPSERLAELVVARPRIVRALGIALGDARAGWIPGGRLAAPLALAAAGARDRDVLAAAVEVGFRVPATAARITRLGTLGARLERSGRALAYLAAALDVDCPTSWLPVAEHDLEAWAEALAWAEVRGLGSDARTYVARYGAELGGLLGEGGQPPEALDALADMLVHEARGHLRARVAPHALLRRHGDRPFPVPADLRDVYAEGSLHLVRVPSGARLHQVGADLRNCLGARQVGQYDADHAGESVHYEIRDPDRVGLLVLQRHEGSERYHLAALLGPHNAELPVPLQSRIKALLERDASVREEPDVA